MDQIEDRPTAFSGLLKRSVIEKIALHHLEILVSRPWPRFDFGKGTAQDPDSIPGIQ
jgi:hypothetical protein